MFSSAPKVIGCLFIVCLTVHAQNSAKTSASISGTVMLKGKGIAGISVGARISQSSTRVNRPIVVTTDEQGNYRIPNLAPGTYEVSPLAIQYVLSGYESIKKLIVAEGETLENIDFALVRGGVITGKVTDAAGYPIVAEQIELVGPEGPNPQPATRLNFVNVSTDDRGVYRIFGVAPGKYRVAAGMAEDHLNFGDRRHAYRQTFHPSSTESSKATVIEVTEGGEVANVDITMRRAQPSFTVTGRIVDVETGKPIPGIRFGLQKFRENGSSATSGPASNGLGEIRIENLMPGKYALFLEGPTGPGRENVYAEPVQFEVVDQDVTDLVLNVSTGSKASGVVVFEGLDEKAARARFHELAIFARGNVDNRSIGWGSPQTARVNADGSFTIAGLRPGAVQFSVYAAIAGPMLEFEVVRIERDGVVQPRIEIKDREHLQGLRLILKPRTGRIRGVVKIENGQDLLLTRVHLRVKKVGEDTSGMTVELDGRGRFMSQGMSAGVYELTVIAYPLRPRGSQPASTKQQVIVADEQITDVTVTLDLKGSAGQERP